jgi:hypothetical protein
MCRKVIAGGNRDASPGAKFMSEGNYRDIRHSKPKHLSLRVESDHGFDVFGLNIGAGFLDAGKGDEIARFPDEYWRAQCDSERVVQKRSLLDASLVVEPEPSSNP